MATDTHTVTVSDMATGALLRISSVAGEALRASQSPYAGMNHAQRVLVANGLVMTDAQKATLAKKAQRNALRQSEREALALWATVNADDALSTYRDSNYAPNAYEFSDLQAGYDY